MYVGKKLSITRNNRVLVLGRPILLEIQKKLGALKSFSIEFTPRVPYFQNVFSKQLPYVNTARSDALDKRTDAGNRRSRYGDLCRLSPVTIYADHANRYLNHFETERFQSIGRLNPP